ncbi:MAG: ATP-binding protein [Reichenbachiella sp.]
MLINFSVKNYRTFKDKASLSLVASNYDKVTNVSDNIMQDSGTGLSVLKSAVIYGANASGKTKLFEALSFMKAFIFSSSKESQKGDVIEVEPFMLNSESEDCPSEFEVIFSQDGTVYRYGFEADEEQIVAEWLYYKPNTKEVELFYRDYQDFTVHSKLYKKGQSLAKDDFVRNNALLLSVAAQFNDSVSELVLQWFRNLRVISGEREEGYREFTIAKAQKSIDKDKILELLKAASLGIQDLKIEKIDLENLPKDMPKDIQEKVRKIMKEDSAELYSDILTLHKKYGPDNEQVGLVNFSMDDHESAGTAKFFSLTGPILDALENGRTLAVDELDSKLHPNLVAKIVSLFNSSQMNPNNAQLIFNTHDTNLLNSDLFRRDQVWFTEKNKYGEARLYSLNDFSSTEVRKNEAFEGNYINGKYGGVPHLGKFDNLMYKKLLSANEE